MGWKSLRVASDIDSIYCILIGRKKELKNGVVITLDLIPLKKLHASTVF